MLEQLRNIWIEMCENEHSGNAWWAKKSLLYKQRGYNVLQVRGNGELYGKLSSPCGTRYEYIIHLFIVLKKAAHFYIEEQTLPFMFDMEAGKVINHQHVRQTAGERVFPTINRGTNSDASERFNYDPQAAVKYAERWWNSYNPAYRRFDVDCTNYISQCLYAGGAPMRGAPNRDKGWWYQQDNWSFSWAVAHSLRWYLSGSTAGLKGAEVSEARDLQPGDIICYDFEGDGRWDHNTIVTAKDADNMPLVNAHTDNSRMRYWSYEDSLAWSPEIQYKFFRID